MAFAVLLFLSIGCGSLNPIGSDSGSSDGARSSDSAASEEGDIDTDEVMPEKTGVPECDELMAFIARESRTADDNYWTKAAKEFALNRVREGLRKSIEENKNDKEELAKKCKEFKTQLDSYKEKEDSEGASEEP